MNRPFPVLETQKYMAEKAQYLQLEYSGISRKELLETVRESKIMIGYEFNFKYKITHHGANKSLKGIRVSAGSKKTLSALARFLNN